jgi:hypothetical protein
VILLETETFGFLNLSGNFRLEYRHESIIISIPGVLSGTVWSNVSEEVFDKLINKLGVTVIRKNDYVDAITIQDSARNVDIPT